MPIKEIKGNIFTTKCEVIVNPVNCVGVMGAGLAFEFKLRNRAMYRKYKAMCDSKAITVGNPWLYESDGRGILNFPTKNHWRHPSKIEYLEAGLENFLNYVVEGKIRSIAFPLLGADRGGLSPDVSLSVMKSYLSKCDIDVEIYHYDPYASDDLFDRAKEWILANDVEWLVSLTAIQKHRLEKIIDELHGSSICQLGQLSRIKGVGVKTLEKLFYLTLESVKHEQSVQGTLPFLDSK